MSPDDVEERGHMDHVVRRAISLGLTPLQAIQAVTINPAIYSGLDRDIGGIAPGRFADIALVDDLDRCHVREVLIGGKIVARSGVSQVASGAITLPIEGISLGISLPISAETFRIAAPSSTAKVRVMELVNQTITAEKIMGQRSVGVYRGKSRRRCAQSGDVRSAPRIGESRVRFSQGIRCQSGGSRPDDESR